MERKKREAQTDRQRQLKRMGTWRETKERHRQIHTGRNNWRGQGHGEKEKRHRQINTHRQRQLERKGTWGENKKRGKRVRGRKRVVTRSKAQKLEREREESFRKKKNEEEENRKKGERERKW